MTLHVFSENLARDRPTSQSAVCNIRRYADRAVYALGQTRCYCAETNTTTNPWWEVDFEQVLPVSEVFIRGGREISAEIRVGEYS